MNVDQRSGSPDRKLARMPTRWILLACCASAAACGARRPAATAATPSRKSRRSTIESPRLLSLEAGQDRLREQLEVPSRQRVGQAAELEEPHEHAGAQLVHVGADGARDRLR